MAALNLTAARWKRRRSGLKRWAKEASGQMPEPYKHLNRITPLIEQVQNVNHQLVEQHRRQRPGMH